MTTYNDKTALAQSPTTFHFLYPVANDAYYDAKQAIKEPDAEYSVNTSPAQCSVTTPAPIATLCDQLEQHLARYHFHHLSLMAMGKEEHDSNDWEFGAHLTGLALQEESESLMTALSQHKLNKIEPSN